MLKIRRGEMGMAERLLGIYSIEYLSFRILKKPNLPRSGSMTYGIAARVCCSRPG